MAITIDYSDGVTPEYIINIPKADMTLISSSPTEIRELDLNTFRQTLNDLMDDSPGMPYPTNHVHTAPLTVAGITLSRVVEILDPYVIQFEDGLYNVNVVGGNSNVSDVVIKNQVGVNTANSAGLVEATGAAKVWEHVLSGTDAGTRLVSADTDAEIIIDLLCNNGLIEENPAGHPAGSKRVTLYEDDGTTIRAQVLISADGLTRTRLV